MKSVAGLVVTMGVAITLCIVPVAAVGAVAGTTPGDAGTAETDDSGTATATSGAAPVEVDYYVYREAPPWVVIRITDNANDEEHWIGARVDEEGYTIVGYDGDREYVDRVYADPNDKYVEEEVGTWNDFQDATVDANADAGSDGASAHVDGDTEDFSDVPYLDASANEDQVSVHPEVTVFGGEIRCYTDSLECNRATVDVEHTSDPTSAVWADYEVRTHFGLLPGGEAFADGFVGTTDRGGFIAEADQTAGHSSVGEYGLTDLHVYYIPNYDENVHVFLDTTETSEVHLSCHPDTGECSVE